IRRSGRRSGSRCNISATAGFWISSRAGVTVCGPEAVGMAWFVNHYECERCGGTWRDEWSCMCDDDCPHCGARHMTPDESEDLTEVIDERGAEFIVLRSPDTAEHDPD